MEKKDIKGGEIYQLLFSNDEDEKPSIVRMMFDAKVDVSSYILHGKAFYKTTNSAGKGLARAKVATPEQRLWLIACEKFNKLVPLAEIQSKIKKIKAMEEKEAATLPDLLSAVTAEEQSEDTPTLDMERIAKDVDDVFSDRFDSYSDKLKKLAKKSILESNDEMDAILEEKSTSECLNIK